MIVGTEVTSTAVVTGKCGSVWSQVPAGTEGVIYQHDRFGTVVAWNDRMDYFSNVRLDQIEESR